MIRVYGLQRVRWWEKALLYLSLPLIGLLCLVALVILRYRTIQKEPLPEQEFEL